MDIKAIHNVYFIGIGGIGMSALARYFNLSGKRVAGYDLTPSPLTSSLIKEGIEIHFDDNPLKISKYIKNKYDSLIIYTPAIPANNKELVYMRKSGFTILKRAEVLGLITNNSKTIAVAGTHGKTSVSGLLSHIFTKSGTGCTAFLGGISKTYKSNFVYSENSEHTITEADEFDRSFLHLNPAHAIITSTDADHLDIYKDHQSLINSFNEFISKVNSSGNVLYQINAKLDLQNIIDKSIYSYSIDSDADFKAINLRIKNNKSCFDILLSDKSIIKDICILLPGKINIENALAAASMAWLLGISKDAIRKSLGNFKGMQRRFDFKIISDKVIFMDDYAHHPNEISAMISSVKDMYPDKVITGIFQPHLFSRTKDFASEFAKSLSQFDEIILLDIYPAREKPIEGVTSNLILSEITKKNKKICTKDKILEEILKRDIEFLITIGAGDIDRLVPSIQEILEKRI